MQNSETHAFWAHLLKMRFIPLSPSGPPVTISAQTEMPNYHGLDDVIPTRLNSKYVQRMYDDCVIAIRLHEIMPPRTVSILAGNRDGRVMDNQPKKVNPDLIPPSKLSPPPLSLSLSLHPPHGCLGYSSVTSGGYWGVKLKLGGSCTPHSRPCATNTRAFQHTQTPARFVGFGMGPLGVITLAHAYRVLWLS